MKYQDRSIEAAGTDVPVTVDSNRGKFKPLFNE